MGTNSQRINSTDRKTPSVAVEYRVRWGNVALALAGLVAVIAAMALPSESKVRTETKAPALASELPGVVTGTPIDSAGGPLADASAALTRPEEPPRSAVRRSETNASTRAKTTRRAKKTRRAGSKAVPRANAPRTRPGTPAPARQTAPQRSPTRQTPTQHSEESVDREFGL